MANKLETQAQNDSTARALTTAAEHGANISRELDAMSPSQKVLIAHKMETYNNADRQADKHLPKLDVTFEKEFGPGYDSLKELVPTLKNDEHLSKITVEKDPDAIFFKGKEDIYENKDLNKELLKAMDKLMDPATLKERDHIEAEREKMVAHLSPEQRKQYDKEKAEIDQWHKSVDHYLDSTHLGPFGERFPEMPATPLHDAIECLTNPNGKPDKSILQPLVSGLTDRPFDPKLIGTGGFPLEPSHGIGASPFEPKMPGAGGYPREPLLGGKDEKPFWTRPEDLFPHSNDPEIDKYLI